MGVDGVTTVGFATTPFSVFPFDFSQFSSFSAVGFVGASVAAPTILVDSTGLITGDLGVTSGLVLVTSGFGVTSGFKVTSDLGAEWSSTIFSSPADFSSFVSSAFTAFISTDLAGSGSLCDFSTGFVSGFTSVLSSDFLPPSSSPAFFSSIVSFFSGDFSFSSFFSAASSLTSSFSVSSLADSLTKAQTKS